jgi:hypothetical protein
MPRGGVLVVGETPSLGRSIVDLLESEKLRTEYVCDVESEGPISSLGERFPVVIVACNEHFCVTARRWLHGELPNVSLVVVGSRDPILARTKGVHQIPLPLQPCLFLETVRDLIGRASHGHRPQPTPS